MLHKYATCHSTSIAKSDFIAFSSRSSEPCLSRKMLSPSREESLPTTIGDDDRPVFGPECSFVSTLSTVPSLNLLTFDSEYFATQGRRAPGRRTAVKNEGGNRQRRSCSWKAGPVTHLLQRPPCIIDNDSRQDKSPIGSPTVQIRDNSNRDGR
ncbi:hypothetical protein BC835DRAFT_735502 [Cytidiella melzeri]|nr:hypothetical protein BC835DRAFT_735502 [Cytidiella melzeri]